MSTESARLPGERLRLSCICGKRYKIAAAKSDATFTCKACGEKVRVPRASSISQRSREAILAELGIDSSVAKSRYDEEKKLAESSQSRVYKCTRCDGPIGSRDVKDAYVRGELVCKGCQASDEVTTRAETTRALESKERRNKKLAVEKDQSPADLERAARRAAALHAALFFAGIFGPLYLAVGARFLTAFGPALLVAVLGGLAVYLRRRGLAIF